DAIDVGDDRGRAFDGFRDRLEADPAAGEARQRKTENPKIEIILQRRRIDHRHQRRGEHLLALMRQRRGLAAMVVAGERNDAAVPERKIRFASSRYLSSSHTSSNAMMNLALRFPIYERPVEARL